MPGVVILPAPHRGNYVYQGLKPAVIVLSKDNIDELEEGSEIVEHVRVRQEEVKEKQKAKRGQSVVNSDVLGTKETKESFNVGKVDVDKI